MAIRTRQDGQPNNQGGNGTGTGDGNGDGEGVLGEEARKEVEQLVNSAVNGAVTNQLARFKKSFTEEITKTLGETLSPISEQLKQFSTQVQRPAGGGEGGGSGGGKKGEVSAEIQEQLARFEGRTKELEGMLAQERKAREEERAARERDRAESMSKEERAQLAGVLRARGIPEPQVKAAVALLHGEEKLIGRTDDGQIVFKVAKGTGQARYIDEVELEKGVEEWLKTDDGKAFVPARQAGGAGGMGARPMGQAQGKDQKGQAANALAAMLLGGGQGG
jgi:hypothetical protein